jgi:hypothetical protein
MMRCAASSGAGRASIKITEREKKTPPLRGLGEGGSRRYRGRDIDPTGGTADGSGSRRRRRGMRRWTDLARSGTPPVPSSPADRRHPCAAPRWINPVPRSN